MKIIKIINAIGTVYYYTVNNNFPEQIFTSDIFKTEEFGKVISVEVVNNAGTPLQLSTAYMKMVFNRSFTFCHIISSRNNVYYNWLDYQP